MSDTFFQNLVLDLFNFIFEKKFTLYSRHQTCLLHELIFSLALYKKYKKLQIRNKLAANSIKSHSKRK